MKKILLILTMFFTASQFSWAQGVPNGNFESWGNNVFFEDPQGYTTPNTQLYFTGVGPNVTKSTDAVSGTYSLRMETTIAMSDTMFGYAVFGTPDNGFLGGFPFTEMPDSFKGHFKYSLTNNDSAIVLVLFKKNGFPLSLQFFQLYGSQSTWTELAFKLAPLGMAPDSAIIGFASSNPDMNTANPGNWLMVDDVSFAGTTSQIPNSSFETWMTMQALEPTGWNTLNLFLIMDGKQSNVTKSSDAYEGNSSISVKTAVMSLFGSGPDTFGFASTGMLGDNFLSGGFPMSKKPDSLSFYYKYNNTNNFMDMAIVFAAFSKFNTSNQQSEMIDSGFAFLPGAFNWKRKSFVFNSGSGIPDTANIVLLSSNLFLGATAGVGNELLVDDMLFYYGTIGVPVISDNLNTVSVYPNPAVNEISVDLVLAAELSSGLFIQVYDIQGNIVKDEKTSAKAAGKQMISIDVNELPSGTYMLSVSDGGANSYLTKFIKK